MAKKKKDERITYKKVLSPQEYKRYIELRKEVTKKGAQKRIKQLDEYLQHEKSQKAKSALVSSVGLGKTVSILSGKTQGIKSERRAIARRAAGTKRLLTTAGVISGKRGRGRPTGTYKYGMPIQQYKKLVAQRKALYQVYAQRKQQQLQSKGLTSEQIQMLNYQRALRAQQPQQVQIPEAQDMIDTPESVMAPVDDDLEFRKFRAEKAISPTTQNILRRLRSVQLKSQRDDVEMQRRIKERKMVGAAGSLLATPFIFNKFQMDVTKLAPGDKEILKTPNVFKEREDVRAMLTSRRLGILQTREGGNDLNFF